MKISKILNSQMPNWVIRARNRPSAVTDRLRRGRANVVELCSMGNWTVSSTQYFDLAIQRNMP